MRYSENTKDQNKTFQANDIEKEVTEDEAKNNTLKSIVSFYNKIISSNQ